MTIDELRNKLVECISVGDSTKALTLLAEFEKAGGSQRLAYNLLDTLRRTDDSDLILDLMDIVTGWCAVANRIWPSKLPNRFLLCEVESCEWKDGQLCLLPGVSQSLIKKCNLGAVGQGHEIELLLPDQNRISTYIANYYVCVPTESSKDFDITSAPIIICLPSGITNEQVPVGTEVWVEQ